MRKTFPLVALVLLTAGCGRSYTAADVQRALGTSRAGDMQYYMDSSRTVFATSAAVTDLFIEETPPLPQAVYDDGSILVQRYRDSHDAWLATHASGRHLFAFVVMRTKRLSVRRYANLVLIGESQRVNATIARLH
jgi:hypothetical protein